MLAPCELIIDGRPGLATQLKLARAEDTLTHVMRALVLLSSCDLALACAAPHTGPAETLEMPKKKKPKDRDPATAKIPDFGGLNEPDTCKFDFTEKERPLVKANVAQKARLTTQDADNKMAGVEKSLGMQRRNMVIEALNILNDALRIDPYSPNATYSMATAYAYVGKKKCALALLDRLNTLGGFTELAGDVGKLKARAKADPAFEPFRKEADSALGGP
jgi:hypothetical protein